MEVGFTFSYVSVPFLQPIRRSFIPSVMSSFHSQILLASLPCITEGIFQFSHVTIQLLVLGALCSWHWFTLSDVTLQLHNLATPCSEECFSLSVCFLQLPMGFSKCVLSLHFSSVHHYITKQHNTSKQSATISRAKVLTGGKRLARSTIRHPPVC